MNNKCLVFEGPLECRVTKRSAIGFGGKTSLGAFKTRVRGKVPIKSLD